MTDSPEIMHLYGVGDHGGGPTRTMLDSANQLRQPDFVFPNLRFSSATDFFTDIEKKLPTLKVPVWKDELYFEYHRGVQTTQAETKKRIRRNEELMLNAEQSASLASLYGETYPQHLFEREWKNLLFDQFHDIMPGSGIGVNYLEAQRNLEDVSRAATQIENKSLANIMARINTNYPGTPVVVFNSMSWPRNEVTEISAQLPSPAQQVDVVDANGRPHQFSIALSRPQHSPGTPLDPGQRSSRGLQHLSSFVPRRNLHASHAAESHRHYSRKRIRSPLHRSSHRMHDEPLRQAQ